MLHNRLLESLPLLGIGQGGFISGPCPTHCLSCYTDPSHRQVGEGNAKTPAFLSQQISLRHDHILERQGASIIRPVAQLILLQKNLVAGITCGRQKGGDPPFTCRWISNGDDHGHASPPPGRDELLLPI